MKPARRAAQPARGCRRMLGGLCERRGVAAAEKWVTLVTAEERGGFIGAGSCGRICMCCSDEMLREIVTASVFSQQISGRVAEGDNFIFLNNLKLFSV